MKTNRRSFLKAGAAVGATLAAPAVFAQQVESYIEPDAANIQSSTGNRFNNSTFRTQKWEDHFDSTAGGVILVDIPAFALHYWNSDNGVYRQYAVAVPLKDEFARRGRTTVVRKVEPLPSSLHLPSTTSPFLPFSVLTFFFY